MMPNMRTTLAGFEETYQFILVLKTVVNGTVAEASKTRPVLYFEGSLQPLHARELMVKPEGQRKWKWWTLWTDMDLHVDDEVKDEAGFCYRVMASTDWRQGDYRQYQLIEGPGVL